MKKRKIIAITACAAMIAGGITACGGDDDKRGSGAGHMYGAALAGNPRSLDPQFAGDPSSATVIKNLYSGLVMKDSSGSIVCCNAKDYTVSEDGCVYTFNLRDDNYWFFDTNEDDAIGDDEYFPVTANDYVFAFRRLLDPKMHSPYARDFTCIKNSQRVMEGGYSTEAVGAEALDDFTLQITLEYPCAEFLGLLTTPAAFPCNEQFFISTKGRYGLDDRSVMSNGPFYVRQWFYDPYGSNNILYMRKNTANERDGYEVLPSFVSFSIQDSEAEVRQCFKEEETECFTAMKVGGYNPRKYSIVGQKATTLGLIFNPKDKLYSNKELCKAVAFSADREALRGQLDSDLQIAYGIIPPAVDILGRSYRDLASDKQFDMFDKEKAVQCLAKAKEELKISSVESVKIIVDSSTVDSRYLHLLSQGCQESLGIYIGIEDLTSKEFNERIANGDYSIALYPLKADFNSGLAVFGEFDENECLRSAKGGLNSSESIMQCPSVNQLVDSYAAAEKALLEQYGFIPLFYKNSYIVANKDNEDIIYDPFTGSVDYRIAKNYS
ncbi:peptide ABC transporter substrate-binding protein [Ruminococcus flavefaciens]|uniref:peptide ABC transporter substrate-binding protein n=1 Tax=Ruminococcus flavefaciens TaxID=1265 RepID=UPI001FA74F70|nr:peptide ABC transporter substrate-binding protein [Ruminococcus flavefaciens]